MFRSSLKMTYLLKLKSQATCTVDAEKRFVVK